jgi:hypothetical protein
MLQTGSIFAMKIHESMFKSVQKSGRHLKGRRPLFEDAGAACSAYDV